MNGFFSQEDGCIHTFRQQFSTITYFELMFLVLYQNTKISFCIHICTYMEISIIFAKVHTNMLFTLITKQFFLIWFVVLLFFMCDNKVQFMMNLRLSWHNRHCVTLIRVIYYRILIIILHRWIRRLTLDFQMRTVRWIGRLRNIQRTLRNSLNIAVRMLVDYQASLQDKTKTNDVN